MYIYPDNLRAKPTLWLWQLRDIGIIGVGFLIAVLALAKLRFLPPVVIVALYGFLTIRFDDTSMMGRSKSSPTRLPPCRHPWTQWKTAMNRTS